jgi:hypothetical protein
MRAISRECIGRQTATTCHRPQTSWGICCPGLLKQHKLGAAAVSQASPRLDRR